MRHPATLKTMAIPANNNNDNMGLYWNVADLLHKFDTSVSYNVCRRVCSSTVTYDWFPVFVGKGIVTGATCGAENAHSFGNT